MKKLLFCISLILISSCSKTSPVVPAPRIGDSYQGGIVFYIFQAGDHGYLKNETHGLIGATQDQSIGIVWGTALVPDNLLLSDIGYGDFNTGQIITYCGDSVLVGYTNAGKPVLSPYAASVCNSLILNKYDDWFLPNEKEFKAMIVDKLLLGLTLNGQYWISSGYSKYGRSASFIVPSIGTAEPHYNLGYPYNPTARVRAIRKF